MNKSYKGKLADGTTLRIRLSTNNGLMGHQIKKLQLFPCGSSSSFEYESFVLVNSTDPGAQSATPDFNDPTLLAAAFFTMSPNATVYPEDLTIVIDEKKVNQDIFISHNNNTGDDAINFYLELEQVKLSKDEATVATLKDMRAGPDTNFGP